MNNSQRVKNIYLNSCPLYMKIIITLLLFNLFPIVGYSATLTVPEQYSSIQSAINASADQDTVLVSPGFYQENISFNGKDIVVTSTYMVEQDSLMIGSTIIDGNNNGIWDDAEDFVDDNDNGIWDEGEDFIDEPNGEYDDAEEFTDDNGNNVWDKVEEFTDEKNGKYDNAEEFTDININVQLCF